MQISVTIHSIRHWEQLLTIRALNLRMFCFMVCVPFPFIVTNNITIGTATVPIRARFGTRPFNSVLFVVQVTFGGLHVLFGYSPWCVVDGLVTISTFDCFIHLFVVTLVWYNVILCHFTCKVFKWCGINW